MGILKLAVLASGGGSNLQAIIDNIEAGKLNAEIKVVISDVVDAYALTRAENHSIPNLHINPKEFANRQEYDIALGRMIQEYQVDLVVLAGYMLLVSPEFLQFFPNKVINIHPALLPAFPGLNAQEQAFNYGVKVAGCTVHFVDSGMDSGPIIAQRTVPVLEDDTADTLKKRILEQEHVLFSEVIDWIAEGRVNVEGRRVVIS